jgi:hypothetical protein
MMGTLSFASGIIPLTLDFKLVYRKMVPSNGFAVARAWIKERRGEKIIIESSLTSVPPSIEFRAEHVNTFDKHSSATTTNNDTAAPVTTIAPSQAQSKTVLYTAARATFLLRSRQSLVDKVPSKL